jgi:hypothetical protein
LQSKYTSICVTHTTRHNAHNHPLRARLKITLPRRKVIQLELTYCACHDLTALILRDTELSNLRAVNKSASKYDEGTLTLPARFVKINYQSGLTSLRWGRQHRMHLEDSVINTRRY